MNILNSVFCLTDDNGNIVSELSSINSGITTASLNTCTTTESNNQQTITVTESTASIIGDNQNGNTC